MPARTRDAEENLKTVGAKSAPVTTSPVKTPDRSAVTPPENAPPEPSPRIDAAQQAHASPPAASTVTKTPESDLPDAARPAEEEKARDDRVRPKSSPIMDSGARREADTPPPARNEPATADPPTVPDDLTERREVPSTDITVTANGPKEETATDGSPATEAPLSQAPTQSTGMLLNTTAGGKSAAGPVESARAGAISPASTPEDPKVKQQLGPRTPEVTLGDRAPASGSEPTTEPAPQKGKSLRSKRLTKPTAPPPSEGATPTVKASTLADLESYLAEVMQKITGLFRDRDGDRQDFLARCARAERENDQFRARLAEAERNEQTAAAALEQARAASAEQVARISALESRLEAGEQATRKAEERAKQLDKDLEDAFREIEETERRAGDKVHRAEKEKELGVKTFRFELRRRIEPYLSEVLDDERDQTELSPEQRGSTRGSARSSACCARPA